MFPRSRTSRPSSDRAGFTLIELLVVLVIIAILFSLSFTVLSAAMSNARSEATRTTIRVLDSALQDRVEGFAKLNFKSQAKGFMRQYNGATQTSGPNSLNDPKIAELIVRKDRYRAAFPQRLEDLWGFDGVADTEDDAPLWRVWKTKTGLPTPSRSGAQADPLESSELLLLALTEGGSFGVNSVPLDSLNPAHIRDANNNKLNEVYDDWGHPLRFYNWPTRLVRPRGEYQTINGLLPHERLSTVLMGGLVVPSAVVEVWDYSSPLNQDPQDLTGALAAQRDGEDFNGNNTLDNTPPPDPAGEDLDVDGTLDKPRLFLLDFKLMYPTSGEVTARALDENAFHTLNTASVPLIISSGPDEELGLFEPSIPAGDPNEKSRLAEPVSGQIDAVFDNISNQQR